MTNQITVNISALTDRVDTLQTAVTTLQTELVQIRNTIPVNLPEFTNPIPVNIQNASPPVDITGISTLLTEIKSLLETSSSPPSMPQVTSLLEAYPLLGSTITTANWSVTTPTDLSAIVDSNLNTATGWGQLSGMWNKGHFEFDLGIEGRYYIEAKIGIQIDPGWPNALVEYSIETSPSGVEFIPVWQARLRPGTTERTSTICSWTNGRYIRVCTTDLGEGQPRLRMYSFKVWKVNVPTG
ncbi:MAG TPA: hypothetical protein DCY88_24935 [Cyanobacteria bacterium UBA11372]|nr:hypothetical protein [Cyanobacteria bacterium UBA11372]